MVSKLLQGRTNVNADDVVKLMYEHYDSTPKAARTTAARPASAASRPDKRPMLGQWRNGELKSGQ